MKTKTGMSIGLALTLMVGVFATMLALGLFTNNEVRAIHEDPSGVEPGTASSSPATVDTVSTVTVNFEPHVNLVADDTITLVFPPTMSVPSIFEDNPGSVTVGTPAAKAVKVSGQTVTLTVAEGVSGSTDVVFNPVDEDDEMVGIINPARIGAYTVMVSTSKDEKPVGVPTDADHITVATGTTLTDMTDVFAVKVDHSPKGNGSPTKVTVSFYSPSTLNAAADTIIIEFTSAVQVPDVLDERNITLIGPGDGTGGAGNRSSNPLDVTVDCTGTPCNVPVVTLTVPDMNPDPSNVSNIGPGLVTVVFRQSAGIKNPTEASTRPVKVETSQDSGRVESKAHNSFTAIRSLSLSSKDGSRGSTVTVTGTGFKNSTDVTVWLDDSPLNNIKDSGEVELCFAGVDSTDTFTCSFVVNASNFSPAGTKKTISAVDGRAQADQNTVGATWTLKGSVTAVPKSAAIGDKVTIEFRDFPAAQVVKSFKLGGENLIRQLSGSLDDSDPPVWIPSFVPAASRSTTIIIPDGLALGRQSLAARTENADGSKNSGTRRYTMTILGAQLGVTPSAVVPNQSVTITGRGYTGGGFLMDSTNQEGAAGPARNNSVILLGGEKIPWDRIEDGDRVDIDDGGSWVATVVIPVKSPATVPGDYELKAIDNLGRPGVAQITMKDRTVDFDPKESRSGTTVNVTGKGWIATNSAGITAGIDVEYDAGNNNTSSSRATPDSDGNFTTTILVPRNAPIPSTNTVTVSYDDEDENPVTETLSHRVPEAGLEISPVSGPGGTIATLTGGGFKAFTSMKEVSVGGLEVQPKPAGPSADRDGVLQSSEILIPGLDPGTHTVKAIVGDAVVSIAFTITDEDALPPPAEDQPTADAFAALIDSGNLIGVFRYDDEAQAYQTYDPDPANAGFNNLETVSSGDIFWVRLREDQTFLGKLRRAEWAQVVLP